MKTPDIILKGKDNGDGMVVRYRTSRGTDVFGLAMSNHYASEDWELGPTWCYLICGRKTTLIDTGRIGNLAIFKTLLNSTGKEISDIDRVIPSHGHDDHDGKLAEILSASHAELWAHAIYRQMISYHPDAGDDVAHPEFPGSCRLCVMPEKFNKHCSLYHQTRSSMKIDSIIEDGKTLPEEDISFVFTPGHAPDSVCVNLEDEVLFTGDTILPDITPHPSTSHTFQLNRSILPEEYRSENTVYGLIVYIRSLKKIASLPSQPIKATFPAHRLFYNGNFNLIHSSADRARDIIQFHINRCQDILRIIGGKPTGVRDIVHQHFAPGLLAGMGELLAKKEIIAHLEVMEESGDVRWIGENRETVQNTGSNNYRCLIEEYVH